MAEFIPPPLSSETILEIGGFEVRNTITAAILSIIVLTVIGLLVRKRKYALVPDGIQNLMESVIEGFLGFFTAVVGDEKKTRKFFPLVMTIFLYIIVSNWMGLLPGFGSIGIWEEHEGHKILVPMFRSAFADINMTLALALIAVTMVQFYGITSLGFKKYSKKFFVNPLRDPIGCFVGLLELVSEFAKIISFSFRLFGNIFAGEVLLMVITFLVPYIVPLPFYGLELFVGFIQALVFSFLTLVFLKISTTAHH